jgi:hypothetical protein
LRVVVPYFYRFLAKLVSPNQRYPWRIFMRKLFATALCGVALLTSCKARDFNNASSVKEGDAAIKQVDAKAYNAFPIWQTGSEARVLRYPTVWAVENGRATPEGAIYVANEEFYAGSQFIAIPTKGSKVMNDVLEYPVLGGRQLKIKFVKKFRYQTTHVNAPSLCEGEGMRLPTIRELFDFCAAGVSEQVYGPNFVSNYALHNSLCPEEKYWSASVRNINPSVSGWLFYARGGYASPDLRNANAFFMCVGVP